MAVARERMYRSQAPRERDILHSLWLLAQGWTAAKVAELFERDPHTIGNWLSAFEKADPQAVAFEHTGGPPAFEPAEQTALKAAVQAQTQATGLTWANCCWKAVKQFIAK